MTRFTVSSHPALIRLATNWQPMVTKMPNTGYHGVAQEKMKRGIAVVFVSVPDLLMDIRDSFGTGGTAEILRSVQRAPCLVLDDFGAERMSELVGEQIFAILNYRYSHGLQTIITTNCGLKALAERMVMSGKDRDSGNDVQSRRYSAVSVGCATLSRS